MNIVNRAAAAAGFGQNDQAGGNSASESSHNSSGEEMVAFEDEDGRDSANALTEACRTLEKLEYDRDDILFSLGQAEITADPCVYT